MDLLGAPALEPLTGLQVICCGSTSQCFNGSVVVTSAQQIGRNKPLKNFHNHHLFMYLFIYSPGSVSSPSNHPRRFDVRLKIRAILKTVSAVSGGICLPANITNVTRASGALCWRSPVIVKAAETDGEVKRHLFLLLSLSLYFSRYLYTHLPFLNVCFLPDVLLDQWVGLINPSY